MKILLTSTGLTHKEIEESFLEMASKSVDQLTVLFIANAATNAGEEEYVEKSYAELLKLGVIPENIHSTHSVDDLLAIGQIKQNVIYVCGGNTFHLLNDIRLSGFAKNIIEALNSGVVYVGVSAGSIVLTPKVCVAAIGPADDNFDNVKNLTGLSVVDYEVSVHSPEMVSFEAVEVYAKSTRNTVYAISNETAIEIANGAFRVIGEKLYKVFNAN